MLFYPCRAAVDAPGPHLCGWDHPPAPRLDRLALTEAEPGAAGPADSRLPAHGRNVRQASGLVRGGNLHGLAVRERDHHSARRPAAEAAQCGPRREERRARVRGPQTFRAVRRVVVVSLAQGFLPARGFQSVRPRPSRIPPRICLDGFPAGPGRFLNAYQRIGAALRVTSMMQSPAALRAYR